MYRRKASLQMQLFGNKTRKSNEIPRFSTHNQLPLIQLNPSSPSRPQNFPPAHRSGSEPPEPPSAQALSLLKVKMQDVGGIKIIKRNGFWAALFLCSFSGFPPQYPSISLNTAKPQRNCAHLTVLVMDQLMQRRIHCAPGAIIIIEVNMISFKYLQINKNHVNQWELTEIKGNQRESTAQPDT